MMAVDVKTSTYIDSDVENIDKDPKFKVCNHETNIKIQEYFYKRLHLNWSEKTFVIKNVKIPSHKNMK